MTDNYATVAGPDSFVYVVARAVLRKWPSLNNQRRMDATTSIPSLRAAPPLRNKALHLLFKSTRYRRQPKSKLTKPTKKPKATWVEPRFVADIEFRDITSDGLLRASSFKGLSKGTGRT